MVGDIPKGSIIALDTMIFIYHLEDNPNFSKITEKLFNDVENETYFAVTSYISILEILVKPKIEENFKAVTDYKDILLTFPNLKFIPLELKVADIASSLRAKYKIKTPDAVQIASAIIENADIYLTNDSNLKKIDEIKIIMLDDLKL